MWTSLANGASSIRKQKSAQADVIRLGQELSSAQVLISQISAILTIIRVLWRSKRWIMFQLPFRACKATDRLIKEKFRIYTILSNCECVFETLKGCKCNHETRICERNLLLYNSLWNRCDHNCKAVSGCSDFKFAYCCSEENGSTSCPPGMNKHLGTGYKFVYPRSFF